MARSKRSVPPAVSTRIPSGPGRSACTGVPARKATSSGILPRSSRHSGPQLYARKGKGIAAISRPTGAATASRTYQRRRSICTHGIPASR